MLFHHHPSYLLDAHPLLVLPYLFWVSSYLCRNVYSQEEGMGLPFPSQLFPWLGFRILPLLYSSSPVLLPTKILLCKPVSRYSPTGLNILLIVIAVSVLKRRFEIKSPCYTHLSKLKINWF